MWAESVVIQSIFIVFKSTVLPLGFLSYSKGIMNSRHGRGGVRGVIFYKKKSTQNSAVTEYINSIF